MDEQNFQNDQVTQNTQTEQSGQQNYYQNNTNTQVPPSMVQPEPAKKTDALAIVSLIVGIISILMGCCTAYYAVIPSVIGIVCAIISKKNNGKSGMATAGLICSIVGIVIGLIITVLGVFGLALLSEYSYY